MSAFLLLLVAFAGLLGLAIGSFLNVVVYRVPAGMSLVHPRSACPRCGHEITARDNVPVVSWLLLRGRCRSCRAPISARYPIVELIGGIAFAGVAVWAGLTAGDLLTPATGLRLAAYLYLAAISIALAAIDLDVHRLPNGIVLPGYAVGMVLLGGAAALEGDWWAIARMAIGGAALFLLYLVLAVVKPGGMGMGDVKLAGVLGVFLAALGWGPIVVGAAAAFLLGGIAGIVLLATRRVQRGGGIPFGPWMLLGAWIGIFAGGAVAHDYLVLVGLG
jgi:leader peptidase (prepilin peptidase) / N-methyltransferase